MFKINNNNSIFTIFVIFYIFLFINSSTSSSLSCRVDINSIIDSSSNDITKCGCDEGDEPFSNYQQLSTPCKSLKDLNRNILEFIRTRPIDTTTSTSNYRNSLKISISNGIYNLNEMNDSNFIDKEIIDYFQLIKITDDYNHITSNGTSSVIINGNNYNKSFISNYNTTTPSTSTYKIIEIHNIQFLNWDNSSKNAIFHIYNNNLINLLFSDNKFENIINRQIIFIENHAIINEFNQYFTIYNSNFSNIYSNSIIPIKFQNISSLIENCNFSNCTSDISGNGNSFISIKTGTSDNAIKNYNYFQFRNNLVENCGIGGNNNNNNGWISTSNLGLEITDSKFNNNSGRLILFNSKQNQEYLDSDHLNKFIYLYIKNSKFYGNSIGGEQGKEYNDDSLISMIGDIQLVTYRSQIINGTFISNNQFNKDKNSIIKLNTVQTFELEDSVMQDDDCNNTVFSSFTSEIMITNSIITSNKIVIGSINRIYILDSIISNDHSKYSECMICVFNYTSSTNSSLNWQIGTIISYSTFIKGVKEIAIIASSIIASLIILVALFIIIKSKKQQQKQQQQNQTIQTIENDKTYSKLENIELL